MALGRPVIATDVPGCRDTVIEGENGFVVPVRDSAALATAMLKFVYAPKLVAEMGARSRSIAEKRFDVHRINAQILQEIGIMPVNAKS
jgi:glycosyltransferase involved in cell wall biosynthesis